MDPTGPVNTSPLGDADPAVRLEVHLPLHEAVKLRDRLTTAGFSDLYTRHGVSDLGERGGADDSLTGGDHRVLTVVFDPGRESEVLGILKPIARRARSLYTLTDVRVPRMAD